MPERLIRGEPGERRAQMWPSMLVMCRNETVSAGALGD